MRSAADLQAIPHYSDFPVHFMQKVQETLSHRNHTAVSRSPSPKSATGAAGTTGARAASPASSPRRSSFSSISGPGASQRDNDGVSTGQEVSERPRPRPRGGNRGLALTGLDALAPRIPSYTTAGRRSGA
eukprot:jgi/Tetstr1/458789/TSEL_045173.t1